MNFEKTPSFNPEESEHRKKEKQDSRKDKDKNFDPERRRFLKGLLGVAGVTAAGTALKSPLGRILENLGDSEDEKEKVAPKPDSLEKDEIKEKTAQEISEIVNFDQPGRIELSKEKIERVKNHQKERHQREPMEKGFRDAFYEMGAWEKHLKAEFEEQGVPKKFMYLAIPESYWKLREDSGVGAFGPYQFIPETARSYNLNTGYYQGENQNIDERVDPIKSARACAKLLKDLYEASGDWDLALSGYNGGFFWRYLGQARRNKEKPTYEGFLSYMGDRINNIKKEVEEMPAKVYVVKKGESLTEIAQKFNTSIEELCSLNNIEDENNIKIGQRIKINLNRKERKEIFRRRTRGIMENLEYPAKFRAIYELIQEGFVKKKKEPLEFHQETISNSGSIVHTFRAEDKNLFRLAQNWPNLDYKDIIEANPGIDPHDLREGETKIIIPKQGGGSSLRDLARNEEDLRVLWYLNPSINNPSQNLPKNYQLRIPETRLAQK